MSEFKLKMLRRVELKSSTTVRVSSLTEVLFPNSVLGADLNPIWDEIIYIPGMSLFHPYTDMADLVSQCTP
jgi:hypothetical protein